MNYYLQTDSLGYIIATTETAQTLSAPWVSIPEASYATAQLPGATYAGGTVNAPAANYDLVTVGNSQIGMLGNGLAGAIDAPVSYTTVAGVASSWANTPLNQSYLAGALVIWTSANWPATFFLRDVNEVKVTLTYADALALGQAMGNAVLSAENKYETLVAQILGYVNGGGTVAEIEAVVW